MGEIVSGKPHGQGTRTYTNGNKYVGEWKDGTQNGQGTYTSSDGRKYVGELKNWGKWNGTEYDKNGNIYGKYVNGKFIKQ